MNQEEIAQTLELSAALVKEYLDIEKEGNEKSR